MPRLTDPKEIRPILETDRPWAAYPLGDLDPGLFEETRWHGAPGPVPAILLVWSEPAVPVLVYVGPPGEFGPLLDEIDDQPALEFHLLPEALPAFSSRYRIEKSYPMRRMLLDPERYRPAPRDGVVPLFAADFDAMESLLKDTDPERGTPFYLTPSMLSRRTYFGVREGGELIAAAGTHLAVPGEGVAALGNIVTRPDRRGRGLAARTTSAVVDRLREMEIPTVVLNVGEKNHPAIRVYERLGFRLHCRFFEGDARRIQRSGRPHPLSFRTGR